MKPDFETQLQRQSLREIPPHWRTRILARAGEQNIFRLTDFWSRPAWLALSAAWVLILALYFATPDDYAPSIVMADTKVPRPTSPLQQDRIFVAKFLDSDDDFQPASIALPRQKPRSERARRTSMA